MGHGFLLVNTTKLKKNTFTMLSHEELVPKLLLLVPDQPTF